MQNDLSPYPVGINLNFQPLEFKPREPVVLETYFKDIPENPSRLQFSAGSQPAGCCCQGCCALMGWSEPQTWIHVYSYNPFQQICQAQDTPENREKIKNKYGVSSDCADRYFVKYFDELKRAMTWLGEQEKTYFMGQAVCHKGTAMYNTLVDVPVEKRRELPVFEETQMGMTIGLALQGYVPVSIFPRWNFLILATNQLVNHLDKYPLLGYPVGCIIRTAEGSVRPLDPQHQHKGSFSEAYRKMFKTVKVVDLYEPYDIFSAYQSAYADALEGKSTILSENGDFYNEK